MNDEVFAGHEALTFDDLLVVPGWSEVLPADVDLTTMLAGIELRVPLMSAAMDTVTEAPLAIAMARAGGIGVLHRNLTVSQQAEEVERVKLAQAGMIGSPVSLSPDATLNDAEEPQDQWRADLRTLGAVGRHPDQPGRPFLHLRRVLETCDRLHDV